MSYEYHDKSVKSFYITFLLSVIFHDKCEHIETTQKTNIELIFSQALRKFSKYPFLFFPHKRKIFILHIFQLNALK